MLEIVEDHEKTLETKTDKKGNHEGSWQGINRPTQTDIGLSGTVEKIVDVDLPQINETLLIKERKRTVNVKDYGAKGDGVTDDTISIQNAFNESGVEIFFPYGHYIISSSIEIKAKQIIRGQCLVGNRYTIIENKSTNIDSYCFVSDANTYITHEIDGIQFIGINGIDLRVNNSSVIKTFFIKNCIFNGNDGLGIAIHSNNTDFSIIEKSFFSGKFYCCIRLSGALNVNYGLLKASTQIKIRDNIFIDYNNLVGTAISLECMDSVIVSCNDFSFSRPNTIDVGGAYYKTNAPRNTNMYYPNTNNMVGSIGWCTNINIIDNHIEAYKNAVLVDGGFTESTFDIRIKNNNFQTPQVNSIAIEGKSGVFSLLTETNQIDMKDDTTSTGIKLHTVHSSFLNLDSIYGVSLSFINIDVSCLNVKKFVKTEPGKKRNEISWNYPKLEI